MDLDASRSFRAKTSPITPPLEDGSADAHVCHGPVADLSVLVPQQWWKTVFADEMYLKTDGDVVEDDDITRAEVALLIKIAQVSKVLKRASPGEDEGLFHPTVDLPAPKILDLCCGQGRHSLFLTKLFPHVKFHGHDQSSYLINLARERSALQTAVAPAFTVGDCRNIPYPDNTFDMVLLMGNSFGYFSQDSQDRSALAEVKRVLAPGGVLVLDLTDGEYMRHNFSPRSWEWIDETTFVCRERQLSKDGHRLTSREIITVTNKGVIRDQFYQERLYSRCEMCVLLRGEGFLDSPAKAAEVNITIGELSKRNEDLGMMANRMFVTCVKPDKNDCHLLQSVDELISPFKKFLAVEASTVKHQPKVIGKNTDKNFVTNRASRRDSKGMPIQAPPFKSILVLLGDPSKPCIGKLNNTWNDEDMQTRKRLIQAMCDGGIQPSIIQIAEDHEKLIQNLMEKKHEFVFNLCDEGWYNDALKELHVPAILETLNIPFSGAGPSCLAFCYDKGLVNASAAAIGIDTSREITFIMDTKLEYVPQVKNLVLRVTNQIGYPAFIKPIKGDNSLGITGRSVVRSSNDVENYMIELHEQNIDEVLVQEYLQGTEYGVGMIGNPETGFTFLPIIEVDFSKITEQGLEPILGFESKWEPSSPYWNGIEYKTATLSHEVEDSLKKACVLLWERYKCRDYARFDFRCDVGRGDGIDGLGGKIKLLEVNPNPGWCWDGKFACMAKMGGYDYGDMLNLILWAAWDRIEINMTKKQKTKPSILDVYESVDADVQERRYTAKRGGGGGQSDQQFDNIENLEFTQDITAENDEEIDEFEAFNDDDEIQYSMFFGKQQDEPMEGEEECDTDDSNEFMNISDMLNEVPAKKSKVSALMLPIESESELDSELDEFMESEDDEIVDTSAMDTLIDTMTKTAQSKKRRITEITEAGDVSEFGISKRANESKKIAIEDLVNSISEETGFGTLKKQLTALDNDQSSGTVDVPMHLRNQDRLNRQAAYLESKKSVSKWIPLIKQNREAECVSFPLNEQQTPTITSGALVSSFEPSNDLEKEINQMLLDAGLTEEKQRESEELALNLISPSEVKERRAELAKMRSLMFYQEQKLKKISKIKSKAYRKVHKKEKNVLSIEDLQKLDPSLAKEERDKADFERAKERMTLKHKNTGKWAKQMLGRETDGNMSQKAISQQLQKHEMLTKRINGDSDENDNSESEDFIQNGIKELDSMSNTVTAQPKEGLFAMKFMQRAADKKNIETEKILQQTKRELENYQDGSEDALLNEVNFIEPETSGRYVYAVKVTKNEASIESDDAFDPEDTEVTFKTSGNLLIASAEIKPLFTVESFGDLEEIPVRLSEFKATANQTVAAQKIHDENIVVASSEEILDQVKVEEIESESDDEGQWFDSNTNFSTKKNISSTFKAHERVGREGKALSKINARISELREKQESSNDALILQDISGMNADITVEVSSKTATSLIETDSEADSDYESGTKKLEGLTDNDLIRMAFANDDVEADFELEKNELIESEVPKAEDVTLPGWGNWSGPGVKESKKRILIQPAPGKGIDLAKRRDAHLKKVIINEKRQKKVAKYMLPSIPHGFDTREQYERTISNPLGKEWNSIQSHANLTAPKITTKLGAVIKPLRFQSLNKQMKQPKNVSL